MYTHGLRPSTSIITCACISIQLPRDIKLYCPQSPEGWSLSCHIARVMDLFEIFTFDLYGDAQKRLTLPFQSWEDRWSCSDHLGFSDFSDAPLMPVSPVNTNQNMWQVGPGIQRQRLLPGAGATHWLGKSSTALPSS